MQTCPKCGRENAADAKFCSNCGAALAFETERAREERKVVTVLFADLVGFTSRAEQMDPEDVRAVLEPYHARLRTELERRGGTVEKFIGDAVMALFGAPTAHEDDPERAVRAALAIRDWIREEGDLQVRIAVTTGEALVALGARPSEGEGMASGDVVNTAARLQSAAPVNGVLVDETTRRATERAIEYRPIDPVEAKGKAEPVPAWEALDARSRFGVDVIMATSAPLIGRERELDTLVNALARVRDESSPQLVTLVGVPGIGKSRLVHELSQVVDETPDLIYWRQGRSLPYGEGISFWALVEMVKAQVGILETDSLEEAERKLERSTADLIGDGDAAWVQQHLGPLVGLGKQQESREDQRVEAFAAWRRYFEAIAEERPLVLVFEDLHWADDGLLDFVDHLVEWATGVSILAVCTARPELLSRREGWGGGKPNALTLSLSPLNDEETARLFGALLERSVLPAETQTALLQRAGGNPLYAEEFVRMVSDRGLVAGEEKLPMPESVQGIVAARLDGLPAEEKALLQDAAVLGKVFWSGAAASIGGIEPERAEQLLHELARKEFVQRERRSSVADESEYAFRHLLVRDVAYSQIPRGQRAEKHRLGAEWIEGLGRPEDHAEMLAYHYLQALEFARAAGTETEALRGRARVVLREAGDRALGLSAFRVAVGLYEKAVDLWPLEDTDRPQLLYSFGYALSVGDPTRALPALTEAREALLAVGDLEKAALAQAHIAEDIWLRGQRDDAFEQLDEAAAMVADRPVSYAKAYITTTISRFRMLAGDAGQAIRLGNDALRMTEELGGDEYLRAHALNNIGVARVGKGDRAGLAAIEESVAVAVAANSWESVRGYGNLASVLTDLGELDRAAEMVERGVELAERFGLWEPLYWLTSERAWTFHDEGQWDEALAILDSVIAEFEGTEFWMEPACRCLRARMRFARADVEGARSDASRALERARVGKDPQIVWPALAVSAWLHALSDPGRAGALAAELLDSWRGQQSATTGIGDWLLYLAEALRVLGRQSDLLELGADPAMSGPWLKAALAYIEGDFVRAADIYTGIGAKAQEAYARLRAAEAFVHEGRRAEADAELERALAFWRTAGATAYIREGEALLAETG
jgi:class 3 adenylate cyclase/tetratricopeptide (TPR) repeat protein